MKKSWLFLRYAIVLCMFLTGIGCTKEYNDITIVIGDEPANNNGGDNNGGNGTDSTSNDNMSNKISFSANVESMFETRSLSAFGKGKYAQIIVYNNGGSLQATPLYNNKYFTKTEGILTPVADHLYLPDGFYDFYSVATNQSVDKDPLFAQGYSVTTLENGIDYLWWSTLKYEVNSSPESIPITYHHSCTQIVLKLIGGNGVTINSTVSATIMPPANTAKMSLADGYITPATILSTTPFSMGINKNVCQVTILPLKTVTKIPATLNIRINNETSTRTYNVEIPIPDAGFVTGDSYLYEAVVNANTIDFNPVSVVNWVSVNETGTPLYPDEIK